LDNYTTLVDIIIQNEAAGTPKHQPVLLLGETPDYLIQNAGYAQLPMAITGNVISKVHFDHGITKGIIKKLPEILANPKALFKSANVQQTDSVVVLTYEIKGFSPIVIPIVKNREIGRIQYNLVTSVYAKEGEDPELKWHKQGLLLWKP
jgi:hypothetical protein